VVDIMDDIPKLDDKWDHFAKYLQDCGVVTQYTMPGSPKQKGVVERCNCTLREMKRSMMDSSNLLEYLWGDAIKTTYILNHVPSKSKHHLNCGQGGNQA